MPETGARDNGRKKGTSSSAIVAFMGLPASGKSTIAGVLRELLVRELKLREQDVVVVDPDEIRAHLGDGDLDPGIDSGTGSDADPNTAFRPELEPEVRARYLRAVEARLQTTPFVIADDMHYYRSMRHELREIATRHDADLFFVHLVTPLEQCLAWNEARGTPVPNAVIRAVAEKFDYPDRHAWERPVVEFALPASLAHLHEELHRVIEAVEAHLSAQPQPRPESTESTRLAEQDAASAAHQLDVGTRKVLSEVAKCLADKGPIPGLNAFRKRFVEAHAGKPGDLEAILARFKRAILEKLGSGIGGA